MIRALLKATGIALALCITFVLVNVVMIYSSFDLVETVVQKVESNNHVDAVLVRREAGATVSTSYSVRLFRSGLAGGGVEVLLIDRVSDPNKIRLAWDGPDLRVNLPSDYQEFKKAEVASVAGSTIRVIYRDVPKSK